MSKTKGVLLHSRPSPVIFQGSRIGGGEFFRERADVAEVDFGKIGLLRSLAVTRSGGHLRSLAVSRPCGHLRSLAVTRAAVTCGHLRSLAQRSLAGTRGQLPQRSLGINCARWYFGYARETEGIDAQGRLTASGCK